MARVIHPDTTRIYGHWHGQKCVGATDKVRSEMCVFVLTSP